MDLPNIIISLSLGLISYFSKENRTGSTILSHYILFTNGTGFVLKGFKGWNEIFQNYYFPAY